MHFSTPTDNFHVQHSVRLLVCRFFSLCFMFFSLTFSLYHRITSKDVHFYGEQRRNKWNIHELNSTSYHNISLDKILKFISQKTSWCFFHSILLILLYDRESTKQRQLFRETQIIILWLKVEMNEPLENLKG
jgi:hypothetical protein